MSSSERRIDTRVNVCVPLRFRVLNNPGSTEKEYVAVAHGRKNPEQVGRQDEIDGFQHRERPRLDKYTRSAVPPKMAGQADSGVSVLAASCHRS